uniref:Probable splicing factor YJU2B n=1 Tax=Phallusia mammillata TaxID=59560 RepID=A0A6F9D7Q8_9ASCI|nr:coiled-coil domain-containing protein 130 [Phallusia mammillata]
MGERKGVNKYYPPDFDYKKHGSLDRYHNSHPLRERARKLGEGILIIRFEMPYNIWCNGCNSHIGMGVRYNAEKKKMGNYYSTIIYKFRMKCHLCEQHFEIQTDPANCEYVILSGARRKEERWDAKNNEQIEMTDHEVKKKLSSDPMYKLEHQAQDKKKLEHVVPTLEEIQDIQEEKRDDYLLNKALRKSFREEKKRLEEVANHDASLLQKSSLDIPLLPESNEDMKVAQLMQFQSIKSFDAKQDELRKDIETKPVFEGSVSGKVESSIQHLSAKLPKSLTKSLQAKMSSSLWSNSSQKSKQKTGNNFLGVKIRKKTKNVTSQLKNHIKKQPHIVKQNPQMEKVSLGKLPQKTNIVSTVKSDPKLKRLTSLVAYSSDASSENSDNQLSDGDAS